jgi:hypothetical protein
MYCLKLEVGHHQPSDVQADLLYRLVVHVLIILIMQEHIHTVHVHTYTVIVYLFLSCIYYLQLCTERIGSTYDSTFYLYYLYVLRTTPPPPHT